MKTIVLSLILGFGIYGTRGNSNSFVSTGRGGIPQNLMKNTCIK